MIRKAVFWFFFTVFTIALQGRTDLFRQDKKVFPNPGDGLISIRSNVRMSRVEIRNMLGEPVNISDVDGNYVRINLSNQPDGVYFYQVWHGQQIIKLGKLVIRR